VSGETSDYAIKVPSLRLQRILGERRRVAGRCAEGRCRRLEDRVLTGFFKQAPRSLWPRAVVIEHLSRNEWLADCIPTCARAATTEAGRTRSNTLLVLG